jgi:hypothetical protein
MPDKDALGGGNDVLESGGSRSRHPLRSAVLTAVTVAALVVWALVRSDAGDPAGLPGPVSDPSEEASSEPIDADPWSFDSGAEAPATGGSTADVFYRFAATGDGQPMSALWADYVTVSVPGRTWTMTSVEASSRDAWWLRSQRHGRGPRDLLRPLRTSEGAFSTYLQDVQCFGRRTARPVGATGRVTSRVLVAIRPGAGTPCARWWAFDLVFTPEDRISQVVVRP